MATRANRLDPVTRYVRGLPGDFLLTREAAVELDISVSRLKLLGRQHPETLGPGHLVFMGAVKIHLYDRADLDQLRSYFAQAAADRPAGLRDPMRGGRGRPPIWTHTEHADRHRRRALARYHRETAKVFQAQGRPERAEQSLDRAAEIQRELDQQRHRRRFSTGAAGDDREPVAGLAG